MPPIATGLTFAAWCAGCAPTGFGLGCCAATVAAVAVRQTAERKMTARILSLRWSVGRQRTAHWNEPQRISVERFTIPHASAEPPRETRRPRRRRTVDPAHACRPHWRRGRRRRHNLL